MNSQGEQPAWIAARRRPRLVLLGPGDRANVRYQAKRLRPIIEQCADVVLEDLVFEADLTQVDADIALVLGGDGSILRVAKRMQANQLPVIGVNLGRLGFLADLSPDEFASCFGDIVNGKCLIRDHLMFHCEVIQDDVVIHDQLGLNEAAVLGGPPFSILSIELYVDSELATSYSCDGLILSTPVGSTAHNLSAGGPIVRKNLQAFVIQPISPHTLTVRPIVDSADRTYEIIVREPNEATSIVVDGRVLCRLTGEERVRIQRASATFKMIEASGHTYYRTLREKLGWDGHMRGQS